MHDLLLLHLPPKCYPFIRFLTTFQRGPTIANSCVKAEQECFLNIPNLYFSIMESKVLLFS